MSSYPETSAYMYWLRTGAHRWHLIPTPPKIWNVGRVRMLCGYTSPGYVKPSELQNFANPPAVICAACLERIQKTELP